MFGGCDFSSQLYIQNLLMWALSDDLQMDISAGHVCDAFTLCCVMHGTAGYPPLRFKFFGIFTEPESQYCDS